MTDITLRLRELKRGWVIEADGPDGRFDTVIDELDGAIPESLGDLDPRARSWWALPRFFAPTEDVAQPGLRDLKLLGAHLWRCLLADPAFAGRLEAMRRQAPEHRMLVDTEGCAGLLGRLPLEILFDDHDQRFLCLDPSAIWVRTIINARWRALEIGERARLLIATAHADDREPDEAELETHANALVTYAGQLGWETVVRAAATADDLREVIVSEGVDIVYVACHGQPDEDQAGLLHLRDGTLSGETFGAWIDEAAVYGQAPMAVLLCACSSATPGSDASTHGMAQYLARKVTAALGFHAPVSYAWALSFTQRLFSEMASGHAIDAAFCAARRRSVRNDPQWALPLLYTRVAPRRGLPDVRAATRSATPAGRFTSVLPRPPRAYFTGRRALLDRLARLVGESTIAVFTSVEGEGGVGKSELARWLAHRAHDAELPVIWLERPDAAPVAALTKMIQCVEPEFELAPRPELKTEPLERLVAHARAVLGDRRGMVILDDVSSGANLDQFRPGEHWTLVATTRVDRLHAAAEQIPVGHLLRDESVELLARIRYGSPSDVPEVVMSALGDLAAVLEDLPLALELAGETMRDERLDPAAYLRDLEARIGRAGEDRARVTHVLTRSLDEQPEPVQRAFLLLGTLTPAGARAAEIALALELSEPVTSRWLDLLTRVRLASYDVESGLYWLHPRLRQEAWERVTSDERHDELCTRGAALLHVLVRKIFEVMDTSVERSLQLWRKYASQLTELEPERWVGRPEAQTIAGLVASTDQFLATTADIDTREQRLAEALAVTSTAIGPTDEHARVIKARADLLHWKGALRQSDADYSRAIALYRALGNKLGQANALLKRADLRCRTKALSVVEADYDLAVDLYREIGDRLGEANALRAHGEVLQRRGRPEEAIEAFERSLALFQNLADRRGEANVLLPLAESFSRAGELELAESTLARAVDVFTAVGDRLGEANTVLARGILMRRLNRFPDAEADFARAIGLCRAKQDGLGEANALNARGNLHRRLGRVEAAVADYDAAIRLYGLMEDQIGQANAIKSRGDVWAADHKLVEAESSYDQAIALFVDQEEDLGYANTLQSKGDLRCRAGRWRDALPFYFDARDIYRKFKQPLGLSNVEAELGRVHSVLGQADEAIEHASVALNLGTQVENGYAINLGLQVFRRHPEALPEEVRAALANVPVVEED